MKTKHNILQLIDSLETGGAERMSINIANALASNNYNSFLCATRAKSDLQHTIFKNVNLLILNKKSFYDIKEFKRLFKYINDNKISVIHAHSSSIFWAVLIKIIKPKILLVWHDHLGNRINENNLLYIIVSIFFDKVITVNKEMEYWDRKYLFLKKKNIKFIKNFVIFNNIDSEIKPNCKENNKFIIVHLANLKPPKNHHLLINALKIVKIEITNFNFELDLLGQIFNDSYYYKLVDLIEKNDLKENINFLGKINNPNIYLEKANLGILCSDYEGLPVSLLEYGMFKLPVISTKVGQCEDVLDYGKCGWLIDPKNERQLADAIKDAYLNAEKRNEMSNNIYTQILNNYSSNNFIIQFKSFINIF